MDLLALPVVLRVMMDLLEKLVLLDLLVIVVCLVDLGLQGFQE